MNDIQLNFFDFDFQYYLDSYVLGVLLKGHIDISISKKDTCTQFSLQCSLTLKTHYAKEH